MRRALRTSILIASFFAAVVAVLVMGVGTARAGDVVVNQVDCYYSGDVATVPAGSTIILTGGWAEVNYGVMRSFLLDVTHTLSVNRGSATTVDFGAPFELDNGLWVTGWSFETGVTLVNPGDTMTSTETFTLKHRWAEETNGPVGFAQGTVPGKPIIYGPGLLAPPATCTITAT